MGTWTSQSDSKINASKRPNDYKRCINTHLRQVRKVSSNSIPRNMWSEITLLQCHALWTLATVPGIQIRYIVKLFLFNISFFKSYFKFVSIHLSRMWDVHFRFTIHLFLSMSDTFTSGLLSTIVKHTELIFCTLGASFVY